MRMIKHGMLQVVAAISLVATLAESVMAQENRECVSGEYVVTVSSVKQLKQKAIQELSDNSDKPLVVKSESPRVILVKDISADAFMTRTPKRSYESMNRLCQVVRSKQRSEKRSSRAKSRGSLVRNISCSCNAIININAPNDSHFAVQWGLNQANNIDIDAPEAWTRATGNSNTVVAVIDTGVLYNHPDLTQNMWRNPSEIAGNGIDDDSNGYVDDVFGINAIANNGNPLDDNGHGTHCAGIAGASSNNGQGIAGVNWNVSIMAAKFLGQSGSGDLYDAIQAIDYVTMMRERHGVNVVVSNNSWGGNGDTWGPLGDAINRQVNAGILFVAAAGNSALNVDVSPSYPANFGNEGVVSVAAVDANGALASFSNYGATKVDIGAPGVNIASTYMNNGYAYLSGTSMAAPMVSGAAALVASHLPGLTWQHLKSILMSTGKPLSALSGKTVTGKMLNVNQLLDAALQLPLTPPTATPTPTVTTTPTITPTPTVTPTPTATPTLVPGYWNLGGTVTGNGSPIANAVVRLVTSNATYTRMTDGSGRYSFSSIYTSPTITITVEASGFAFEPASRTFQSNMTVDFSASNQLFELALRVINPAGNGVPGIEVDAGPIGPRMTDAQGYVRGQMGYGQSYKARAMQGNGYSINDPERSGVLYGNTERVWVAKPD